MNCKLEKFWNNITCKISLQVYLMNCKLEKFWNTFKLITFLELNTWTVNLKSFEI